MFAQWFIMCISWHVSVRFWLVRGEDGHAVYQHHPCQASEPLHRGPELHESLQLQERAETHQQRRAVQHTGGKAADLRQSGLSRGRLRRHHAGCCVWSKCGERNSIIFQSCFLKFLEILLKVTLPDKDCFQIFGSISTNSHKQREKDLDFHISNIYLLCYLLLIVKVKPKWMTLIRRS